MEPMRRILVFFDNRMDPNWGSQATTTCLFEMLKEKWPNAVIQGIPRSAMHHVRQWRSLAAQWVPRGIVRPNPIGQMALTVALRPFRKHIAWCDGIIVNGEGTLHDQDQAALWLSVIAEAARISKAPLHLVNCTIQPGGSEFNALLRHTLGLAHSVVLREPSCAPYLAELYDGATHGADAACLLVPDPEAARKLLDLHQVSGGYALLTGAANGREWDLVQARSGLENLLSLHSKWIFCASTRTDRLLHERLCSQITLVTEIDIGPRGLSALIQGADLHVGGRYHPTLFALWHGTPCVIIESNTPKISGLKTMFSAPVDSIQHDKIAQLPQLAQAALNRGRHTMSDSERNEMVRLARLNVWPEEA